jgi:hypothetical protein
MATSTSTSFANNINGGIPLALKRISQDTALDQPLQQQISDDVELSPEEMERAKLKEAMYQTLITLVVAIFLFSIATTNTLPLSHLVGVAYLAIFTFYLYNIFYLLCRAQRIYRVYSVYEVPSKWVNMPIAAENREWRQSPIVSISEFSAIGGGAASMLLARLGSYAFAIVMTFVCSELTRSDSLFPCSLLLECIGAFGVVVLGTFYDDPFSKGMQIGHYVGVALSCCTMFGFLQQRIQKNEHVWIPVLLMVVFVVFFVLFMIYPSYPSSDHHKVTWISLRQIAFEAVALFMLTISAGLYFIMYTF